jgi:hypothetical protein
MRRLAHMARVEVPVVDDYKAQLLNIDRLHVRWSHDDDDDDGAFFLGIVIDVTYQDAK